MYKRSQSTIDPLLTILLVNFLLLSMLIVSSVTIFIAERSYNDPFAKSPPHTYVVGRCQFSTWLFDQAQLLGQISSYDACGGYAFAHRRFHTWHWINQQLFTALDQINVDVD